MQKTTLVVAFFLAALLAGLFVHFNTRSSPLPSMKEDFMQKELGMPIGGGIGPYDSVSLDGGVTGFASNETSTSLASAYPPASQAEDGKLMFLVGNTVDSKCCPAAFNTDTGCVCLTDADKDFMGSRGGNRA